MDRCRCLDYEKALNKLKFFTVGTLRPDIIENYNKDGFTVSWIKIGISYDDMKFLKPKGRKILQWHEIPGNQLSKEARKIEQMWCPFMTPHVVPLPEDGEPDPNFS